MTCPPGESCCRPKLEHGHYRRRLARISAGQEVSDPQLCSADSDRRQGAIPVTTKLRPPPIRQEAISRERLLECLRSGSDRKLTLVACPAGFGKTTLLAAWCKAEAVRKPVAWLTLDEADNDPVTLWSNVIRALGRAIPQVARSFSSIMAGSQFFDGVLPRLVNELDECGEIALILDDYHRVSDNSARQSVSWFVEHAPATFQLVVASRTEPMLSLGALRAHGELVELRASNLRFTSGEAGAFLNGRLGLGLTPEDVDGLTATTEGWAAGLYLAALSMQHVADRHGFVARFGGSNRHVVDFLLTEVLQEHDPPVRTLMRRASVLEQLSGSLCDAVMERQDSAATLETLSRTNLFLVPLDDKGEWYRFHPLLRQLLRVELERLEPGTAAGLNRRAFAWHRDHGMADASIRHALEAGAYAEAAELIETYWVSYTNSGRGNTILAWLSRFPDEIIDGSVGLLLIQAWVLSMVGKREEASRAVAAIDQLDDFSAGALPAGFGSVAAALAMLRASFPWGDIGEQLENARRAASFEAAGSPLRTMACRAMGMGMFFHGDTGEADLWFAESAALALASGQWLVGGSSLAYRSLIAGERGSPEEQRLLAEQACELVRDRGIEEEAGEAPLALGMSLAARGKPEEALPLIERAVAVLRSRGQPIGLANALLYQMSLLRRLGDSAGADAVTANARCVIGSCPDPGILTDRLGALERPLRAATVSRGEDLTHRELRVLRMLQGEMSERDIGGELYVAHSTVHSHVRAIYRKLGVSSRANALQSGRQLGLI